MFTFWGRARLCLSELLLVAFVTVHSLITQWKLNELKNSSGYRNGAVDNYWDTLVRITPFHTLVRREREKEREGKFWLITGHLLTTSNIWEKDWEGEGGGQCLSKSALCVKMILCLRKAGRKEDFGTWPHMLVDLSPSLHPCERLFFCLSCFLYSTSSIMGLKNP